ncbi:unnamed protein product, partial [Meganyctiphanes norvegica]
ISSTMSTYGVAFSADKNYEVSLFDEKIGLDSSNVNIGLTNDRDLVINTESFPFPVLSQTFFQELSLISVAMMFGAWGIYSLVTPDDTIIITGNRRIRPPQDGLRRQGQSVLRKVMKALKAAQDAYEGRI